MITNTCLIDKLPKIQGRYSENIQLSKTTWFRVGGPAEVVFKPASIQDLQTFIAEKDSNIPLKVVGVGSNLLVRDGGITGVVIKLGKGFTNIFVDRDENTIEVGAAILDKNVALMGQDNGIGGLEFLCGIPGTIGGALRMNAGAYGTEIKDVLVHALAINDAGELIKLSPDDMQFSYRHCGIPESWVFVGAKLKGHPEDPSKIKTKIDTLLAERDNTQPVKSRTGGSTFANPDGNSAWKLIDQAGCRGLKVGDAMMSEKHCNFMINTGAASAHELESLGETVRQKVEDQTGIKLRWEIQRIGNQGTTNT